MIWSSTSQASVELSGRFLIMELLVNYECVWVVFRACKCTDPETGELRRFGFVDFSDHGVVRKVMNITKHYIKVTHLIRMFLLLLND